MEKTNFTKCLFFIFLLFSSMINAQTDADNDGVPEYPCEEGSQAKPYTSLGQAWQVSSDGYYWFDIDGTTFSTFVEAGSGWVLIASGSASTNETNYNITTNLTKQSDKILPSSIYSSTSSINKVRIQATSGPNLPLDVESSDGVVLANLYANRTLGSYNNGQSWTGAGAARMVITYPPSINPLNLGIYHASGNYGGVHWLPGGNREEVTYHFSPNHLPASARNNLNLWVAADSEPLTYCGDNCPDTPEGEGVNAEGCSCSQVDWDDDDPCTLDECENGTVTHTFQDTDGDTVCDALDGCPDDPNKTEPGVCGCGVADTDTDGDGVPDCIDNCIETPNPLQEDVDEDGIGDECDACPTIPDPSCSSCGNGKYLVCHLPEGNPENAQQLCLPYSSAESHIGNHGGCYWGVCNPAMASDGNNAETIIKAQRLNSDRTADNNNPLVETASGATYYFEMSPNPASSSVNIHLHGQSNDAHLYIHDLLGRMVWNQAVSVEESSFNLPLQDYRFGNGVYLVTLVSNGDRITRRLVISK